LNWNQEGKLITKKQRQYTRSSEQSTNHAVFEVDTNYSISIDQMEKASKDWTIREYEEQGMNETLHYLINMLDPLTKQTLCVVPGTEERPKY
jgi:hypothetical protein